MGRINHGRGEYLRGNVTTNTIEFTWALLNGLIRALTTGGAGSTLSVTLMVAPSGRAPILGRILRPCWTTVLPYRKLIA